MFCRNCGKDVVDTAEFCPQCGARPLAGTSFCSACGAQTTALSEMCTKCGTRLRAAAPAVTQAAAPAAGAPAAATGSSPKTKLVAFLLCTFLGTVGAHSFYVGKVGNGIGRILMIVAASIFIGMGMFVATSIDVVGGTVLLGVGYVISGGLGIWVFVDWIMILVSKYKDSHGRTLTAWTR